MRILLTGATGFIGSYTARELLAGGHAVRALVRDEVWAKERLPDEVELAVGDVRDAASVERAAAGCDAAIHAAAEIGITGPGGGSPHESNVAGTRNVVSAALGAGCDPVVHVSTIAVFVPPREPVITAESPLASPRTAYGRSKLDAERWVRERQAEGAPVTVVYPGGVIGPDQPRLDATMEGIAGARRIAWPVTAGGVCLVDVRDVARILAAAVERPGEGPARLMLGGWFATWPELGELTDEICGRRARRLRMPPTLLSAAGQALDVVRRVVPLAYPLTRDAAEIMTTMVPTDDSATLAALGVDLRPLRDSLEEALRWMVAAGHLPAGAAPRLANEIGGGC